MLAALLFSLAICPETARVQPLWEPFLAPAVVVKPLPEDSRTELPEASTPVRPALPKLAPARTVKPKKAPRRKRA